MLTPQPAGRRPVSGDTRATRRHGAATGPDADAVHDAHHAHHAAMNGTPRVAQLARLSAALNARAGRAVVQRLPLTDAMWRHIAKGEVNNNKLVGYHWTGDPDAIAQKSGAGSAADPRNVYTAPVETKLQKYGKKKNEALQKAKDSTFWPDDWTAEEIKATIKSAGTARQTFSEVPMTAAKEEARGMMLQVNPDSVFPVYQPETETNSGGRKGGKRR